MRKINILKFLDRLIGMPLTSLLPSARGSGIPVSLEKINKILIIRPGGIGDAVLLLPAVKALREKLPSAKIHVLCEKRNFGIFLLSKAIDKIYLYDQSVELFGCLRNNYDVAIDAEQWHRLSAAIAYFTRAPVKIGFDTNERRKLFTHKIPYSHDDYEVYSFFHLIGPLAGKPPEFNINEPFIAIPDVSPNYQLSVSEKDRGKLIAIFPGASVKERKWEVEKFSKVAKTFMERGFKIAILGSPADRKDAEYITKHTGTCMDLTGRTTLTDAAVILKNSRLLLTADSGLMHIAYAVGTPTVALFGSGIEKKWAPRGDKHTVINKHLDCSPCTKFGYTPPCKHDVECLTAITAEDVIEKMTRLLEKTGI